MAQFSLDLNVLSFQRYGPTFDFKLIVPQLETDSTFLITGWGEALKIFAGRIDFKNNESSIVINETYFDGSFDIMARKDSAGYMLLGASKFF